MPKREDERDRNKERVDVCSHGHWRGVCSECKAAVKDVFANVVWPDVEDPCADSGEGRGA